MASRSSRTSGIARTSARSRVSSRSRTSSTSRSQSYDKFLQSDVRPRERRGGRAAGGLSQRLPDQGLQRDERARLRVVQPREAEVRRRRVPPARHDLRGADQGDHAADDLRHPRGRRAHRPRHQGAGGLLRRDPADDGHRYVHHQRHRARRRQPAAPQPGRLLRPRQGQDALQRASCSTPRASSPTAARGSTSSSTPRTSSTSASTGAGRCTRRCCCARSATRTQELLNYFYNTETVFLEKGAQVRQEHRVRPAPRPARDPRHQGRRRGHRQEEPQVHPRRHQEAEGGQDRSPAARSRPSWSARSRRRTSSTRRPARSCSSATRR